MAASVKTRVRYAERSPRLEPGAGRAAARAPDGGAGLGSPGGGDRGRWPGATARAEEPPVRDPAPSAEVAGTARLGAGRAGARPCEPSGARSASCSSRAPASARRCLGWCWRPIRTRSRTPSTRPGCRRPLPHRLPLCGRRRAGRGLPAGANLVQVKDIQLASQSIRSSRHDPGRARRHPRDRPDPGAGRAVLHPDPGRSRRRDRQGRAAAGRRGARLGTALQRGAGRLLLRRRQPQQALARPRSGAARGPRRAAPPARARRRADRELQARRDGEMGPRLRRRCCSRASRAWSIAGSAASATTGRWAASRATTR